MLADRIARPVKVSEGTASRPTPAEMPSFLHGQPIGRPVAQACTGLLASVYSRTSRSGKASCSIVADPRREILSRGFGNARVRRASLKYI